MPPLFQIPSFFQGAYIPTQPENCCCGSGSTVNVNVGDAPPTVGPIISAQGTVVRRADEVARLIADAESGGIQYFQGA